MDNHNLLPTDRIAMVDAIDPSSQATGDLSTGWVDMSQVRSVMAIVAAGALGASATLDAKLEQAQDGAGTGVKDIAGKAIAQLTKAGTDDNKQAIINCRSDELDFNGGFTHVRLTLSVGTAASLTAAVLLGLDLRYGPASDQNGVSVDEIVA